MRLHYSMLYHIMNFNHICLLHSIIRCCMLSRALERAEGHSAHCWRCIEAKAFWSLLTVGPVPSSKAKACGRTGLDPLSVKSLQPCAFLSSYSGPKLSPCLQRHPPSPSRNNDRGRGRVPLRIRIYLPQREERLRAVGLHWTHSRGFATRHSQEGAAILQ